MMDLDVWEGVGFLTLLVNANMGHFWAVFWAFVNMLGHMGWALRYFVIFIY